MRRLWNGFLSRTFPTESKYSPTVMLNRTLWALIRSSYKIETASIMSPGVASDRSFLSETDSLQVEERLLKATKNWGTFRLTVAVAAAGARNGERPRRIHREIRSAHFGGSSAAIHSPSR